MTIGEIHKKIIQSKNAVGRKIFRIKETVKWENSLNALTIQQRGKIQTQQ